MKTQRIKTLAKAIHQNSFAALCLASVLWLGAGCSKSDEKETVSAPEQEMELEMPSETAAPAMKFATVTTIPTQQISELPPLSPEMIALIETNRSALLEHQIYYIVNSDFQPLEKAQALFTIYSSADHGGQRKVAHAAVKFVDDAHFAVVREQLFDSNLHRQVLSVFMTDTLKRSDAVRIPVLYDLARLDGHPMQGEAKQLLGAFVGRDYGSNWDKWHQAMLAYLGSSRK
jgi:hypothetical protein